LPIVPDHVDLVAAAPAEDEQMATVRIALSASPAQCRCGQSPTRPARRSVSGSSPSQHIEHALQRLGIDITIDPHASTQYQGRFR
jgi:hypothetical protein